ncbi:uncharacterized protein HD556DRAFT_1302222 [Suillus plorans]|uniref:Uncharacterized protein n=1 Tax=Suillus plorans TaxID=116603 RepID=A0A9P7J9E4_9AGAM|nr:uncharacterized protein HD556DRAFT_1302222 [Suillus plorans]KAG1809793.1 hypothetical protein HD556DRAFT_1302222 [Suillus plorans]
MPIKGLRLKLNIIESQIQVMVKYYGYVVSDSWLHQRALDIGYPPAKTSEESRDIIRLASRDVMGATGVLLYTRFRRVKTPKGRSFWCIALACDDPCTAGEHLPVSAPPEATYKALKEALGRDGPPHWYRAI